jgi:hypothetical protein
MFWQEIHIAGSLMRAPEPSSVADGKRNSRFQRIPFRARSGTCPGAAFASDRDEKFIDLRIDCARPR